MTGGAGFLGRRVCAYLEGRGVKDVLVPRSRDYDLTNQHAVERLFLDVKPSVVIHLAARVGGIGANREHPGEYFYANMAMGLHLIEAARQHNIRKFVQVGTVCAYPKFTPAPFKEDELWNGYPEETNAPYGIAKKALFVMLDGYRREYGLRSAVVVPVNLYGPGDNFDLQSSHVIPALIRKCESARINNQQTMEAWGTGSASREFLYVDDCVLGIIAAAERLEDPLPVNLGTGREITIRNLTEMIARLSGFEGSIVWDTSKPDGQPRRQLDVTRAKILLGGEAQTGLEEGLQRTIAWWREQGCSA
ncbi:MAG TPA: GDP-L-fucose synthase [Gemmatales bacterium]|nr:GDP-L-fucose synthase [Gemmatales bacterium]